MAHLRVPEPASKDRRPVSCPKMRPNHLTCPLVAECSTIMGLLSQILEKLLMPCWFILFDGNITQDYVCGHLHSVIPHLSCADADKSTEWCLRFLCSS